MEGYNKSVIDVKIHFDKERERQFKDRLDKEYSVKRTSLPGINTGSIKHLLAIKPSNLSRFLDEDFAKREVEINSFRKVSLNAVASPLLTKALVKKTTEKLANVKVTAKEKWRPLEKFRWTARIILVLVSTACRWRRYSENRKRRYSGIYRSSKSPSLTSRVSRSKSFRSRLTTGKSTARFGFDMNEFSKSDSRVPPDLQDTLTKTPSRRTEAELMRIQKFCRGLGIMSNFPVNRELDASRLIGYERYDKGRVMCLQERIPQRFYYILAGRVSKVRSISLTNGIEKKYYGELYKGQTTDAEELQSQHKRNCTLVCTSTVEVLLFEREDFMALLNSKGNSKSNITSFLSTIEIFRTFPVDELEEDDKALITKYYPKDTIIVPDLKEAEHLYVVKTGICKVLRKLFVDDDGIPMKSSRLGTLPRIERDGYVTMLSSASSKQDYDVTIDEARRLRREAKVLLHELESEDEGISSNSNSKNKSNHLYSRGRSAESKVKSPNQTRKATKRKKEQERLEYEDYNNNNDSSISAESDRSELKLPLLTAGNILPPRAEEEQRHADMTSSSSGSQSHSGHSSLLHLGSLKRGDVYGIDSILHRAWSIVQSSVPLGVSHCQADVTNLVLLSEGAECVLIKKSSFLQKADFCTLAKIVSSNNDGFASEREFLEVDKERAWKDYKQKTVKKLVQERTSHQLPFGR